MTFYYFAYGSNMLTRRLVDRCPSARRIGIASASGHTLEFSKKSIDTSGKATLVPTKEDHSTPGVIFEIKQDEKQLLDSAEGKGYKCIDDFSVVLSDGGTEQVKTYIASEFHSGLSPFDWYLAVIIAGAKEHKFHEDQINRLLAISYEEDTSTGRNSRSTALNVLALDGYDDHKELLR